MLPVTLPKLPLYQFKPVQQYRQQALGAYCSDIYTVIWEGEVVGTAARYLHTSGKLTAHYMGSFGP